MEFKWNAFLYIQLIKTFMWFFFERKFFIDSILWVVREKGWVDSLRQLLKLERAWEFIDLAIDSKKLWERTAKNSTRGSSSQKNAFRQNSFFNRNQSLKFFNQPWLKLSFHLPSSEIQKLHHFNETSKVSTSFSNNNVL